MFWQKMPQIAQITRMLDERDALSPVELESKPPD